MRVNHSPVKTSPPYTLGDSLSQEHRQDLALELSDSLSEENYLITT